jgi:hypothetical protein
LWPHGRDADEEGSVVVCCCTTTTVAVGMWNLVVVSLIVVAMAMIQLK